MYVCICEFICILCMQAPIEPRKEYQIPWKLDLSDCELLHGCWGPV